MTNGCGFKGWAHAQLLLGSAAAALMLPATAYAQTGATPETATVTDEDEIIVTAQKREQRLLDVPMAITAITGEEVERRGAGSLRDLQYSVPGLSLVEQGPGQQRIQIRGISNSNGLPTFGQYLDEMPMSIDDQTQSLDLRLIDMRQIEVLRGPQGTLYGEGSMGGTIRYLTADPDLTSIGGSFDGEVGAVRDGGTAWRASGVLNLPLVQDRLGVRLVVGYENTGGWIDSTVTGKQDVNRATILTLRGKILANFTENLSASVMVLHHDQTQGYQNWGINRRTTSRVAERNNPRYDLVNFVVRWDLGGPTLVNSFGYQNAQNSTVTDQSATYVPFVPLLCATCNVTGIGLGSVSEIDVVSDELRLISAPGKVEWTVGIYGRQLDRNGTSRTVTTPGTLPLDITRITAVFKSRAWAAFGELTVHPSDALTITGGIRYFHETRTLDTANRSFGANTLLFNSGEFSSFNPRLNISYHVSPTSMFYVSGAKGFRSGGFNLAVTGGPNSYDPDKLWTYEFGTKHQLFDRRLTLEGAVYYTDWSNVQSSFVPTGATVGYITNGGDVQGWGVELAMNARPVDGLTLTGTYGWNNLEYQGTTAEHRPGDPVDYAVRESWSGSIDFRRPVAGDAQGFARVDYLHAGPSAFINRASAVNVAIGSRDLVNGQFGIDFGDFEIAVFGTNLLDVKTPIIPGPFGAIRQNIEPTPRIIGARFKAGF